MLFCFWFTDLFFINFPQGYNGRFCYIWQIVIIFCSFVLIVWVRDYVDVWIRSFMFRIRTTHMSFYSNYSPNYCNSRKRKLFRSEISPIIRCPLWKGKMQKRPSEILNFRKIYDANWRFPEQHRSYKSKILVM